MTLTEQARHLSMTNKMGNTIYSYDEIESMIKKYQEMFQEIDSYADLATVLLKAKEELLQFVTKGILTADRDFQLARDFIVNQSDDTFKRIVNYWKLLRDR